MPNSVLINGLLLEEPLVIEHHREPMLTDDQADYLYTAHLLTITGTYNPQTNSFKGPKAQVNTGNLPAITFAAIRHALEQPQGSVKYTDGQNVVLDVKGPDAKNGPYIKVHDIQEQMGVQTYVVSVSVLIYMNEVSFYANQVSPILSHRYKSFDDFDEDFELMRTIQGEAYFRTDQLATLKAVPDQFRAYLFHPTPNGFKLDACHVEVDSDGASLNYTMVFRQKPIVVVAPRVTRIEAFHTITGAKATQAETAIGVAQGFAAKESVVKMAFSLLDKAPTAVHQLHVRVWGYPGTTKNYLTQIALLVAKWRLKTGPENWNAVGLTYDLTSRFVELTVEDRYGAAVILLNPILKAIGINLPQGDAVKDDVWIQEDDQTVDGKANTKPVFKEAWTDDGPNKNKSDAVAPFLFYGVLPPVDKNPGSRGNYLGQLVMSALLGTSPPNANVTPPMPSLPPEVTLDRNLKPAGAP